jgi:hypothetical protein
MILVNEALLTLCHQSSACDAVRDFFEPRIHVEYFGRHGLHGSIINSIETSDEHDLPCQNHNI